MGWDTGEEVKAKKGMELSTKILLGIIACVILIIILILILMMNINQTTYTIRVDGKEIITTSKSTLLTQIDNVTYVNIEEFAKLVGYAYHKGEYKTFTIAEDKCYVQGTDETASFYLNDNKVCKLPVGKLTEDYQEYTVEQTIKNVNGRMYASIDAITLAFNVYIKQEIKSIDIYTLNNLVNIYDKRVKSWGYTGISDQNFENKKAILYGYLIVKKDKGLYKIIDDKNTKEIVSDRYNAIQFTENTKEFFVTNSLEQVGIINLDGTTKIEPIYNSISVLDKKDDLYLIQKDKLYGVVKSGNITIIYPEYDKIGVDTTKLSINLESQYILLDTLIPVSKNNKWGAFDKKGNQVLKVEYESLGCNAATVEVNETKKVVNPVLIIEECKGIVVKKNDKYGVLNLDGKELVPIAVDSIYSVEDAITGEKIYYMLYHNEELNIIDRLIKAGLLADPNEEKTTTPEINNNTIEVDLTKQNTTNTVVNNSVNNITNNE